jgi:two-component system sensor histidine kinase PhoQ
MSSKDYLLSPGILIQGEVIINEHEYFYTSLGVAWEREDKSVIHSTFSISEATLRFNSVLHQYRLYLWVGLIMLTVILLVAFALTLYWGLLPLNYLADDLQAIESGKKDRLEGSYPLELSGLANNLNELIEHEKRQHTRYRNTLGNLAHSLKTPLAVLRGMVDQQRHTSTFTKPLPIDAELLGQQVSRMDEIVQHQLQRAVHVGPQSLHKTVALAPLVARLENVIEKVYHDKITRIDIDIPTDTVFRGDEGDLMEIIGNLMDNAGKYGNGRLRVSAKNIVVSQQSLCCISVEDDGIGIASDKISDVLRRGVRADERHQGQGIGLAVVIDIVDQYQGKLSIKPSSLGGACIELLI